MATLGFNDALAWQWRRCGHLSLCCSCTTNLPSKMSDKGAAETELKTGRRESRGAGSPPAPVEGRPPKFDSPFDANLLAARKRSQQERLWDIFASYALQLSCEDPTRMRTVNVVRLLQDCGVIDSSDSDAAKMIEREVAIICESFLRTHPSDRDASGKKLDFPAFLALLKNFASMVRWQSSAPSSVERHVADMRTCRRQATRTPIARTTRSCGHVWRSKRSEGKRSIIIIRWN